MIGRVPLLRMRNIKMFSGSLFILLLFLFPNGLIAETSTWSGTWDTVWRNGGARLVLTQEGDEVTGSYEPYGGKISAQVKGKLLSGEWVQEKSRGEFVFTMAPDGKTFVGRYDTGEWWNGGRVKKGGSSQFNPANVSSPRSAIRSFLIAYNQIEVGRYHYSQMALQAMDFSALGESIHVKRANYPGGCTFCGHQPMHLAYLGCPGGERG